MSTSFPPNPYRTQRCDALRLTQKGETVRLAGWIARKRDHGNLLFVDLRDHWGITQCVIERPVLDEDAQSDEGKNEGDKNESGKLNAEQQQRAHLFAALEGFGLESVLSIEGCVRARSADTINPRLPTGEAELEIQSLTLLSSAAPLPMPVHRDADYPEDLRLQYRFLDLRRESMRQKMLLRSQVIASLRRRMVAADFVEFQTPILTASSPEGARDFLVPSRLHPQQFYALPQAPQQFKQLLMIAGFERYFQIAPCFRDEDARADRSPGEFYQLDFEMAFATQDEIMHTIEDVLAGTFEEFANAVPVSPAPFPRLTYDEALLRYGSDKPDLRNPLEIVDASDLFAGSNFALFAKSIEGGACVRALRAPAAAAQPRSFFDKLNAWAREQGQGGLGYIAYPALDDPQGPIARNISKDLARSLATRAGCEDGDALFFVCAEPKAAALFAGKVRERLAEACSCSDKNRFAFCWVVDFPMYERESDTGKIVFSHNPFSMPKGGLKALESQDPLSIVASQYDIVCNGIELSSGALRNHELATLERAFAIAGYEKSEIALRFPGMVSALQFGAPPHGGAAPGIERMVMLLAGESNIREVTCFPLNQTGQDSLMGAPAAVSAQQLKNLGLKLA